MFAQVCQRKRLGILKDIKSIDFVRKQGHTDIGAKSLTIRQTKKEENKKRAEIKKIKNVTHLRWLTCRWTEQVK